MPDIWEAGEGDAWYQRNMTALRDRDRPYERVMLQAIAQLPRPQCVLDVGCADGWLLNAIQRQYDAACRGVDVSVDAVVVGNALYPGITLFVCPAHDLPWEDRFDLVIVSFVLHWVDRAHLAQTVFAIDRALSPGGHLLIADFLPDRPTKRRYHHRADVEAWTYKQDYARCWTALGTYREVARQLYDHATWQPGNCEPDDRAAIVVLRKEEAYVIGNHRTVAGADAQDMPAGDALWAAQ